MDSVTKMDIPGSLPVEIFHEILKYLPHQDLYSARDCCTKWRSMMQSFWKIKCLSECYSETEDDLNSKLYQQFMRNYSRWEAIYLYNSQLENNWLKQNYRTVVNTVEKLSSLSIKFFSGDVIVASSNCDQILVINATTAMIEKRFQLSFPEGIITSICAVELFENKLIVAISSLALKQNGCFKYPEKLFVHVWDIETGEPLSNMQMENTDDIVYKVIICKDLITVLSHQRVAYIYNLTKNQIDYRRKDVNCVCYDDDKVAIGSSTGAVVVLDSNYTELVTLDCCDNDKTIIEIQLKDNYVVTIYGPTSGPSLRACIWNVSTGAILYHVERVFQKCLAMFVQEKKLCYLCGDFKLGELKFKLCNLDTGDCVLEIAPGYVTVHNSFVLQRNNNNSFSLTLWSLKTGKLISDLRLVKPFSFEFFENNYMNSRTKTKFLSMHYNRGTTEWSFTIMDFEAGVKLY